MTMVADYWWVAVVALALLALAILWIALARRPGVGTEAAASLRDLDGTQAARPTFARREALEASPEPLATPLGGGGEARIATPCTGEPIAVAPASPTATADGTAASPAHSEGDDLTRMKGLGPRLRDRLAELGVTRFEQIAAWDDAEIDRVDAQLDRFHGRIRRDDWVEQARFLAADDRAGYEDRFGALE